jgi:signal transduction histidine kinase
MASLAPLCRTSLSRGEGMALEAKSGIYVPLWARSSLVGLLVVEKVSSGAAFSDKEATLVGEVGRHAALALDNARLFHRLRSMGAEEERARIARELHDRVGQSLAHVALCLDRLAADQAEDRYQRGAATRELQQLATDLRRANGEIRMKLSDLRTDLTEKGDVSEVLRAALGRVERRSGLRTDLVTKVSGRLHPSREAEVGRIALEAIHNAERHAAASCLLVRWACDGESACLEVSDDGRGIPVGAPLRPDAYGIVGMRERAEAINACLTIDSQPGRGTTLALSLGRRPPVSSKGAIW